MKNLPSVPVSSKRRGEEGSIPIPKEELFQLHNCADGLRILRDIAQEAPELQLIQAEILINKTSRYSRNLIHQVMGDRWQECYPDVDLIQKHNFLQRGP